MSERRIPEFPELFERVRASVPPDVPVWLVGGSLRDLLLGRETHDLDFAVAGDALGLARRVARGLGAAFYPLDDARNTGRVIVTQPDGSRSSLDFAGLRAEDLVADLTARDFTINAMAVSLHTPDELIDPAGGQADLRAKVLRACSPTAISDDPVRALRAVRMAVQFDLRFDRGTREQVRAAATDLGRVSAERVRDEFFRALGGRRPAAALRALDQLGLLERIVPESVPMKGCRQPAPHLFDVWAHSVAAVEWMDALLAVLSPVHDAEAAADLSLGFAAVRLGRYRSALADHLSKPLSDERPTRALLLFASLLHDVGKPATRKQDDQGRIHFYEHDVVGARTIAGRAAALRLSAPEVERVRKIVRHHMRPLSLVNAPSVSPRAVYRFFRSTGAAGVDITLLSLADTLATYGHTLPQPVWQTHVNLAVTLLHAYYETREQSVAPPGLLTGSDLIAEFGLKPGPRIGQLLESVREAQVAGELPDRASALEFVRRQLRDPGAGGEAYGS